MQTTSKIRYTTNMDFGGLSFAKFNGTIMESSKPYNCSIFDIIAPEKVTSVLFCYVRPLIIPKHWEDQLRCLRVVIVIDLSWRFLPFGGLISVRLAAKGS